MFLLLAPTVPLSTSHLPASDYWRLALLDARMLLPSLSSRHTGPFMTPQPREVCFRAFALAVPSATDALPYLRESPLSSSFGHWLECPQCSPGPFLHSPYQLVHYFMYLLHLLSVSTHWTVSSVGDWLAVVFSTTFPMPGKSPAWEVPENCLLNEWEKLYLVS